jgi:conjugal transfer pilus assembly protein TraD
MSEEPYNRPFWLFPAAIALMLLPATVAYIALGAALIASGGFAYARRAAARRAYAAADSGGRGGVLIGRDARGRPVVLGDGQLAAHGLIVGASGAGKSTTMLSILTEHVARGRPVVAIDMKGSPDFARQLEAAAASAGRPFRVWTMDGGASWNPLAHGNATELKDKLIATERFTEPHYQRAAERYVQMVLQVLQEARRERPPTLDEVVDLMDPNRVGALLRHLPAARAERVQDYVSSLTSDQLSAIRGLGTRLAIISESHTGRFLTPGSGPELDVRSALAGNEVVLFSLNSSKYGKLAAQLGTLAVQDLVTAVGHRLDSVEGGGGRPTQALVGIDEFSALGSDNVISLLARGRASGVSALLATQELADLDRAAPGLRDQILGITAIKIAHRQDVPASAQTIAQMAGTEKVWERTYRFASGVLGGYGAGGTRRQVEQFIVHPNEVKRLRTGEAIVLAKQPEASARTVRVAPPRLTRAARSPAPATRRPERPAGRGGAELG